MDDANETFDRTTFDYVLARRAVDLWVDHLNDKHVNWAWEIVMGTAEVYADFAGHTHRTQGSKGRPVATAEQRARAGVLPPPPAAGPRLVVDQGADGAPTSPPARARGGLCLLPGKRPLAGESDDTMPETPALFSSV